MITRALDTMGKLGLVSRRRDEADRRNVVIQRTAKGALAVERLGDVLIAKAKGTAAVSLDPRITPARPDLAAKHLEGKVTAARFVEGEEREVIDAQAPVRAERPRRMRRSMTEALMGERVTVYEIDDEGWAWGQLADDGYVGLAAGERADAAARRADPYGDGAAHARVSRAVDQAAAGRDAAARQPHRGDARAGSRFAVTPSGFYLPARHLAPLDSHETDFVAVAERFLGTPYLWGGKTNLRPRLLGARRRSR